MSDGVETRFDIKIKWNLIIKDEIKEKNQLKKNKKITIKKIRIKLNIKY
jgi:hypothetical protein